MQKNRACMFLFYLIQVLHVCILYLFIVIHNKVYAWVSSLPKLDCSSSTSASDDWKDASGDILSSPGTTGRLGAWGLVFLAGFKK